MIMVTGGSCEGDYTREISTHIFMDERILLSIYYS